MSFASKPFWEEKGPTYLGHSKIKYGAQIAKNTKGLTAMVCDCSHALTDRPFSFPTDDPGGGHDTYRGDPPK
jgi:hypothetical protein